MQGLMATSFMSDLDVQHDVMIGSKLYLAASRPMSKLTIYLAWKQLRLGQAWQAGVRTGGDVTRRLGRSDLVGLSSAGA